MKWTSEQDHQLESGLVELQAAVLRGISGEHCSEPLDLSGLAERLAAYGKILLQWQEAFHLLGESQNFVDLHLLDSVSGAFLLWHLFPEPWQIVDVGSGLGLPGIPLALCAAEGTEFYLVEAGRRRANILRSMLRELGLQSFVTVCEHPVEQWNEGQKKQAKRRIVTCRAFRPLDKKSLKQLQAPLIGNLGETGLLLYKGAKAQLQGFRACSVFKLPHSQHQRCLFYSKYEPPNR